MIYVFFWVVYINTIRRIAAPIVTKLKVKDRKLILVGTLRNRFRNGTGHFAGIVSPTDNSPPPFRRRTIRRDRSAVRLLAVELFGTKRTFPQNIIITNYVLIIKV
jgi:hypothetical protein